MRPKTEQTGRSCITGKIGWELMGRCQRRTDIKAIEDSWFLFGGGGPRFRWSGPRGLELWGHALFGRTHFTPQTAFGPQEAFAYEAGGGVDIGGHYQKVGDTDKRRRDRIALLLDLPVQPKGLNRVCVQILGGRQSGLISSPFIRSFQIGPLRAPNWRCERRPFPWPNGCVRPARKFPKNESSHRDNRPILLATGRVFGT